MGSLGGESDGKTKRLPLRNLPFNFVAPEAVEVEETMTEHFEQATPAITVLGSGMDASSRRTR